ncbi:MAG: fumarylacetoacetate hydrolase family protein, partial [Motiliproteus sp.]|nr:fumarylacetoacetate hydrolase family protein [Motiliproteus sp.]
MHYQHHWADGEPITLPSGKAVCVGRNYADHAKELNNPVPSQPLLFIKPFSAMVPLSQTVAARFNQQACHFETELTVLIGESLINASPEQAKQAVAGIGLGLDL